MDNPESEFSRLTIREWSQEDRPREKYAAKGASALSDAELIAILLRTGTSTESAVDIAKRILHLCGNQLNRLADLSLSQLTHIKGIGTAKAITLQTAFEIGRRVRAEKVSKEQFINSSDDVVCLMQNKIAHLKHEEFWAIFLNQGSRILQVEQIGKGGLTNTIVDVRIIMQKALAYEATAIIVCHNHPSGSLRPSRPDFLLTKQIQEAANILDIKLLDHIVIHKEEYYSFMENNVL